MQPPCEIPLRAHEDALFLLRLERDMLKDGLKVLDPGWAMVPLQGRALTRYTMWMATVNYLIRQRYS